MKKINTLILMCFVSVLMAQDVNPTQVTVIEGFKPQIPESEKIKEVTQFSDTAKIDRTQKYSFVEKTLNTGYDHNLYLGFSLQNYIFEFYQSWLCLKIGLLLLSFQIPEFEV